VSETERDPGWSEQYAETGGWPPPAEGQRSYGPGGPPADPSSAATAQPTEQTGPTAGRPSSGSTHQSDTGGYAQPGQWGQPADRSAGGYPQPGQTRGDSRRSGQWGQPGDRTGGAPGQSADDRASQWGAAADQAGAWGQPADQPTEGGRPTNQAEAGPYGQPGQAWAPGDSAYGRLSRQTPPPPPQQRPRRPWEGRPAPVRRRPAATPVVTITLIAICVVVYLVQQADPAFTGRYALIPYAVEQGQYARLVTSAFLHASVLHLATNMITLYIVGAPLERVLRPVRYLIVYFLSAIGGSLFSVWLSPEFSIGVGASGAIFGLFGALVVLRRQVGAEAGALAVLIGLNLVISFAVPNISWQAHIGGLVTGVLVALALRGIDRVSRRRPAA